MHLHLAQLGSTATRRCLVDRGMFGMLSAARLTDIMWSSAISILARHCSPSSSSTVLSCCWRVSGRSFFVGFFGLLIFFATLTVPAPA
jgi:hypothetical protein